MLSYKHTELTYSGMPRHGQHAWIKHANRLNVPYRYGYTLTSQFNIKQSLFKKSDRATSLEDRMMTFSKVSRKSRLKRDY